MNGLFDPQAVRAAQLEEERQRRMKGLFHAQQAVAGAPDLAGRLAGLGSALGQTLVGALSDEPAPSPAVQQAQKRKDLLQTIEGDPSKSDYFFGGAKKFMEAGDVQGASMFLDYGSKLAAVEAKGVKKPENLVNLMEPTSGKIISRRKDDPAVDKLVQAGWVETSEAEITSKDLKSGTEKEIEVNLGKLDNQIARLGTLRKGFDEKYLTWAERGKQWIQSVYLKAGGELDAESKAEKVKFETFKSDVLNNLNLYIKEITGAQMSEHEAKRIIRAQPNMGDDPVSFEAKLNNVTNLMEAAAKRSKYALDNGYDHVGTEYTDADGNIKTSYTWKKEGETLGLAKFLTKEPAEKVQPKYKVGQEFSQQGKPTLIWNGERFVVKPE